MIAFLITLLLGSANSYTVFPAGKCPPQDCTMFNPYLLVPNSSNDKLCFTVYPQVCDSGVSCCNTLKNVFEKIAFKTYPECFNSVEKVTINGIKKGGGVYITNYTGFTELKVTAIRWTINDALYKTFCVHLRPPCQTLNEFCRGSSCTYSVYDPFTHDCCPTCDFVFSDVPYMPGSPVINMQPRTPYNPYMPNEKTKTKLLIKAPILDASIVDTYLCPVLKRTMNATCKIFHVSSSGIYYGFLMDYDFDSLLKNILYELDLFTSSNKLLCDSSITLTRDTGTVYRYRASKETCNKRRRVLAE